MIQIKKKGKKEEKRYVPPPEVLTSLKLQVRGLQVQLVSLLEKILSELEKK